MTRIGKTFQPDPQTHEIYDQFYSQIYLKMYKQLQPFYRAIRKIG